MNGRFFIIASVIAVLFMSCSESTTETAKEEGMYLFCSNGPAPTSTEIRPILMSKDANGIYSATAKVDSLPIPLPAVNYYFVLISENKEMKNGVMIYGDSLTQAVWRTATKPDTIAYPFANKVLKKYQIGIITPQILPIKVMRPIRPSTLVVSFNPTTYALSVQ
jgi:hypothetical protein